MDTNFVEPSILKKFEVHKIIGKGAYGVVFRVLEKQTQTFWALKKNYDCFRNTTNDAQKTYREVTYLKAMKGNEHIVDLEDIYSAMNERDIYMKFAYLPTDLHAVIRSNISLTIVHMQFITYQMLKALKYIHSAGLMHRDIKPSNILIDTNSHIKICDFGLCRSMNESEGRHLTDYVATRWYRPPEVLLCSTHYTDGIDTWAVACVLGEMIRLRPLLPGNSTMNQLEKILEIANEDHKIPSACLNPIGKLMLESVKVHRRLKLRDMLAARPVATAQRVPDELEMLDFMENLLCFDPLTRFSAESALAHSWLSDFHNPRDEPLYEGSDIAHALSDNKKLSIHRYRKELESMSSQ